RPWREAQRIDEVDLNRGYISWRSPVGDSPFTETDRGSGWNLRSQVRGTGGTPQQSYLSRDRGHPAFGQRDQASARSSVWYFGAMAFAFSRNSASCSLLRAGGGVVRVATGTPTSRKKLSLPAG